MSPTNRQRLFKDWLGENARQLAECNSYAYDYFLRRTDGQTIEYFAVGSLRDDRGAKVPGTEKHFSIGDSSTPAIQAWTEWVVKGVGSPPFSEPAAVEMAETASMPALRAFPTAQPLVRRPQFAH